MVAGGLVSIGHCVVTWLLEAWCLRFPVLWHRCWRLGIFCRGLQRQRCCWACCTWRGGTLRKPDASLSPSPPRLNGACALFPMFSVGPVFVLTFVDGRSAIRECPYPWSCVLYYLCLFVIVCVIASQHTRNQRRLQQYITTVYVSFKLCCIALQHTLHQLRLQQCKTRIDRSRSCASCVRSPGSPSTPTRRCVKGTWRTSRTTRSTTRSGSA